MSIEWDINLDFGGIREAVAAAGVFAVARAAEHVRAVAAELTPVRSGDLVGNVDVRTYEAVGDGAMPVSVIRYPGPYARRQHYELTWRHTKGQALYLEQPMITEKDAAVKIMADTIRDAL